MPQLDKVSFFSQYFWLLIFFFSFYIWSLKQFLPKMSRILKFRNKRFSESALVKREDESVLVEKSVETLFQNLFRKATVIFKARSASYKSWFSKNLTIFSAKEKKGSLKYLQSIAKKVFLEHLSKESVESNLSIREKKVLLSDKGQTSANNFVETTDFKDFSSVIFYNVLTLSLK